MVAVSYFVHNENYFTTLTVRHLFYDTYFTTNIITTIFLQNGTNITKCISFFITECGKLRECYYKMRQLLQNEMILLQNATAIIKWVVTSVHSCFQKLFSVICLIAQNK